MKNISLVTGGAGFIGSHVTRELIKKGHTVVVLDDLSGGFTENVPPEAIFEEGSILNRPLVEALFKKHRFRYVYHLAAYAAEGLSHYIKHHNYQVNLIGAVNLINLSVNHGIECFVFTSSIAVYGAGQMPFQESTIPHPEDSYGIAKLAVELDLEATHKMFGLNSVIFRPHNVYGEYQNIADPYRNVVGIFMNQILQNKPMTIFGDGSQTRAFSYIGDIAPFIADAVDQAKAFNQIFNVGADTPCALNVLAQSVAEAMGAQKEVIHLPARQEVQHAWSSHERFQSVFGAARSTPLAEGLRRMAEWVKKMGPRSGKPFDHIEIEKNFVLGWKELHSSKDPVA